MRGKIVFPWGAVLGSSSTSRLWRTLFSVVFLVLALGSTGHSVPAHAAPSGPAGTPVTSLYGTTYQIPGVPYCPKFDYVFGVGVIRIDTWTSHGKTRGRKALLPASSVLADVKDTSIGTIAPPGAYTTVPTRRGNGYAHFTFHAIRPGSTELEFDADPIIPPMSIRDNLPVTVSECHYKVLMLFEYTLSADGIYLVNNGNLQAILDYTDDKYKGSGRFNFHTEGTAQGPDCTATGNFLNFSIPTEITGDVVKNKLKLDFSYGQADEGGAVSGGCGGELMNSTAMDANRLGFTTITLPPSGATKKPKIKVPGKLTLIVERIAHQ